MLLPDWNEIDWLKNPVSDCAPVVAAGELCREDSPFDIDGVLFIDEDSMVCVVEGSILILNLAG